MIILVILLIFQSYPPIVLAEDYKSYFAKILLDKTYLYRTPNDIEENNIYFILPKTYFVELTDEDGDFYKVNYLNLTGYVKKNSVQAITGAPQHPYLDNITFRIYAELSKSLRTAPNTTSSTEIFSIPVLTKNITYYGEIPGECLIEGRTDIWYYCKYVVDNHEYYGYVYSDFCDELPIIEFNSESVTFIENPSFIKIAKPPKTIPLNNNLTSVIIGILSVPALIFVLLIIKGKHILNKDKLKSKEVTDY